MEKFTKSQLEAIQFNTGPAMVLAGPGSGKTTVITHRIHNLICKYHIPPEKILVVTFTKAAATNMSLRFKGLMSGRILPVCFGTFHSVFYKMLRIEMGDNRLQVINEGRRLAILKEICAKLHVDINGTRDFVLDLSSEIGKVRGNDKPLEDYSIRSCERSVFGKILKEYDAVKKREGLIDFEDMLVMCHEMLKNNPRILHKWQEIFRYILVDEFQDINSLQYEIIRMLGEPENNIFIVGDDDQSIYGFRGARPDIMLGFDEHYHEAKHIYLSDNFRSTAPIVKCANKVIRNNTKRFEKNVKSYSGGAVRNSLGKSYENDVRNFRDKRNGVDVRGFSSQGAEINYVCKLIKGYEKQGIELSEIALLVRNNDIIPLVKKSLLVNGIGSGRDSKVNPIFLGEIAKDISNFIKAASLWGKVPLSENEHYLKVASLVDVDSNDMDFHMSMIKKLEPYAAINYIRNAIGYDKYLKRNCRELNKKLDKELEELGTLQSISSNYKSLDEWLEYVEEQNNIVSAKPKHTAKKDDGVNVMTMHASKGLEFKVVIILNANQGVIPGSKACRERDYEEERRVYYVALTRAKEYLHVFYLAMNLGFPMEESMFVGEMFSE